MKKQKLTKEELLFLGESNKIERESDAIGSEAMDDAIKAWKFAKKSKNKFCIETLLKIHKILLGRIAPHYAGVIRTSAVMIGNEIRSQSKEEIIKELTELFRDYNNINFISSDKESMEEYIKQWHIKYEHVHPFGDSNGRSGRILMNLQRLDKGLPILVIYDKEKHEYYKWFQNQKVKMNPAIFKKLDKKTQVYVLKMERRLAEIEKEKKELDDKIYWLERAEKVTL